MAKLQGRVSNTSYVWRSENGKNTCEVCKHLDGEVFESFYDAPAKPHPNCRCKLKPYAYLKNK